MDWMKIIGLVVVGLVVWGLYWLICFESGYSAVKTCKGEVTDMDYTPSRTVHTGKSTIHHAEKNEVSIKSPVKETTLDSDELYQRVRIGESVTIKYQEQYLKPRFWEGSWSFSSYRLISVKSERDLEVEFNDVKPTTRGLGR